MRVPKYIVISLFLALPFLSVSANNYIPLSDEAQLSVLTCTAGEELYTAFGHTAVRVYDPINDIDWTFNYGTFDFSTPHFYYKFVRGETYYQLAVQNTDGFRRIYDYEGRQVFEQTLNLSSAQKQKLFDALLDNYQPQNRYYLYNFVFDNCATRVADILKQYVTLSNAEYARQTDLYTFRRAIDYYTGINSWGGFGIDFIFGKDADKVMTAEQHLFLPEQLMLYLKDAVLSDGEPVVKQSNIGEFGSPRYSFWLSPKLACIVLCLLILVLTWLDCRRKKISWWFDVVSAVVFSLLGIIGCMLTFFSIHPLVTNNFNLLLYNPLWLVFAVMACIPKGRNIILNRLTIMIAALAILLLVRIFCGQPWHTLMSVMVVYMIRWEMLRINIEKNQMNFFKSKKTSLLAVLLSLPLLLQAQESKLTVVVCIDGLNAEVMNKLRPYWRQGGLRTLDEEAHESSVVFEQLVFGGDETVATLMTGTTPSSHGLAANTTFDRTQREVVSVFADEKQKGINTAEQLSPAALLTPTLSDEFRLKHTNRSKIYAVGIHPSTVLTLAGHSANAGVWIEPKQMRWATTTYYSEGLPRAADEFNVKKRFAALTEQPWTPRMDINMYIAPTDEEKKKSFSYNMQQNIYTSPAANTAVIELALALQKAEKLGTVQPDLMLLELSVESPKTTSDLITTAEQEDMYIRLNQDLGYMIEQLQKAVGKQQLKLVVFGKPHYGLGSNQLSKIRMKQQEFNTERSAALVNTYLMAIYGHERWIDGGYGQSIYLNRTLIEQKKMSVSRLQEQVSDFLMEFEGVALAFPAPNVSLLPADNTQINNLRHTYNKHCFGDILFLLEPCWIATDSKDRVFDSVVEQEVSAPLYILTSQLTTAPERIVKATEVKNVILR